MTAGCSSKADRVQAGLGKATRLVQEGQWERARLETRNVLQMDPRNAAAWALSARVAEALGDYPKAWSAWQQSAELDPARPETRLAIARLELLSGDTDGAARDIDQLLAQRPAPAGARALHAAVAARRGDLDGAVRELREVVGQRPPPVDASLMLASLLVQRDDRAGAVGVLDAALVAAPGNVALLAAAAQACDADPALAARALDFHRRAVHAAPQDLAAWRAWAAFHVRRHELDAAEAVLREAAEAGTEPATLAWIDFLATHRGLARAESAASAAIAAQPDTPAFRLRLAALQDDDGRPQVAEATLRDLARRDPGGPAALAAQDRLAERAWAAGHPELALEWLGRTLTIQPRDADALRLRGRIALAQQRAAAAVVDLRTAVHDAPGDAQAVGLLAQALRGAGSPQLARDALADAVRFKPDDPALRLLLAADMAEAGDRAGADAMLDAAIRAAPQDARAYAAKARLAMARGDAAAAEQAWRARLAAAPDDADAWLDAAAIAQIRRGAKAALAVLDDGARQSPERRAVALARAEWLARQGRPDAAIEAYRHLHALAPDDAAVVNNLAWLLAQREADPASLADALQLAQALAQSDEARYLDTLGWIQWRAGQAQAARATLERAARRAPEIALIQQHLAAVRQGASGKGQGFKPRPG